MSDELDDIMDEVCEGCDGRGRCPERPCVGDADFGEPDDDTETLPPDPRDRE